MPVTYHNVGKIRINSTLIFSANNDGEPEVCFVQNKPDSIELDNVYALFDSNEEPIFHANEYLLYRREEDEDADLESLAKGLMSFFDFCESDGIAWNYTHRVKSHRALYKFRDHLQELHETINPETGRRALASSTAKSYRNAAVSMVLYWFNKEPSLFTYSPCKSWEVKNYRNDMMGHATPHYTKRTTDLKIKAHDLTDEDAIPNHLSPLVPEEKQHFIKALNQGIGIERKRGFERKVSLPIEFKIACKMALGFGLRNSECRSFSNHFIVMPPPKRDTPYYIDIAPELGCETKGGTLREVAIPSNLMRELFKYKQSSRYQVRLALYKKNFAKAPNKLKHPPLLLNQHGYPYARGWINARWIELRKAIQKVLPTFEHKFHNLRPTYATYLTLKLMSIKYPADHKEYPAQPRFSRVQVEQKVQAKLGHSDPSTTRHYVKFWEDKDSFRESDKAYEEYLDSILGSESNVDDEFINLLSGIS
ncbi:TPA: site-specific integrase [Vibrio parahaemolyticus]|nr:site-specific integrase [Vibrio parahaemolyticus]HBH7862305.1 site-specific integrase [Vibrio parahaemolyticus]HBH7904740.1 site-specific integrase [Vibrio parahaemolyticus]